jgi:hypothetical protein
MIYVMTGPKITAVFGMSTAGSNWQSVEAFFAGLAAQDAYFEPMRRLVQEIADSEFAHTLYPWTSMHALCISQTRSLNPHESPHLSISLKSVSEMEFRYIDSAIESRQWSRMVAPDRALDRLLYFFGQLNWFGRRRL